MSKADLLELVEVTERRLIMASAGELAAWAAHEYDEEAVLPPHRSPGDQFLRSGARAFARWIRREGRFPDEQELPETETVWHREEASPAIAAQAFVDLGLFFSHHADGREAGIQGLLRVLDAAAEELAVTLLGEYGPLPA